jgi:glycosyltransferase involved in cell wall biosynthesis
MKIFLCSSVELSSFAKRLIRRLDSEGFSVKEIFIISEKSYRVSSKFIILKILRLKQYIIYPIQLVATCIVSNLKKRNAIFLVTTNTFFAPLLATFFNIRVVHLVYDLFPEAMIHSGKWQEGQFRVKFFRWLVGISLRRSAKNIFLGERLKKYVESIHGSLLNSQIIAVGADEAPFTKLKSLEDSERIKVLYCGNFGNMHESETLFDAWRSGIDNSFQFLFHCSGPKRKELELFKNKNEAVLGERLQVNEGLSNSAWVKVMQSSQIALVTMSEGSQEVVMPSKTYSAMMAGQAILAVAPEDSDLVDLIKAAYCGWWVSPGDVKGFQECLLEIQSNQDLLLEKRQNAFRVAHEQFGQGCLAKQWVEVFESLQK